MARLQSICVSTFTANKYTVDNYTHIYVWLDSFMNELDSFMNEIQQAKSCNITNEKGVVSVWSQFIYLFIYIYIWAMDYRL